MNPSGAELPRTGAALGEFQRAIRQANRTAFKIEMGLRSQLRPLALTAGKPRGDQ